MAIFHKVRCEYSANNLWLESLLVVPIDLLPEFPAYQRQILGLWESSDRWLPVVRGVRAIDRAATACQQVFLLVWVRQAQEKAQEKARKELELVLARESELARARVLEFQQQAAEFLCELAVALVSAWELVRGSIARLDLRGPPCDRPSPPVRVPKRVG